MKHFIRVLLIAVLITGCSNAKQVNLGQNNNNQKVLLNAGDSVVISLKENPSTGYSWRFFLEPEQQKIIADISETYKADNGSQKSVGAGGIKTFRFKAKHAGTITLTGYYYRPWETLDKDKADKVTYRIIVK